MTFTLPPIRGHFVIQSEEDYNFVAGQDASGHQVLMGVTPSGLIALFFDKAGRLVDVEYREIPPALPRDEMEATKRMEYERGLWPLLDSWKQELGFEPCSIEIAPFFLDDWQIGIACAPAFWQSFLENPLSIPDPSFRERRRAEVDNWRRQGNYVLWWCGKEYWMSGVGEVTDT
jgi:hypothetical protein